MVTPGTRLSGAQPGCLDPGLPALTRFLTEGLQWLLDASGNIFFGRRRWPFFGPIPWTALAAVAAIVGYYPGGWQFWPWHHGVNRPARAVENRDGNDVGPRHRGSLGLCHWADDGDCGMEICVALMALTFDPTIMKWAADTKRALGLA